MGTSQASTIRADAAGRRAPAAIVRRVFSVKRRAVAVTLFAPVALAVSLSAGPSAGDEVTGAQPVEVQQAVRNPQLRDEAAMVLVGAALIALASAVRRV
jgi:hypothetical protein